MPDEPEDQSGDKAWNIVAEIEHDLMNSLEKLQDKYRIPMNVMSNICAGLAHKMEALTMMWAIEEDEKDFEEDDEEDEPNFELN